MWPFLAQGWNFLFFSAKFRVSEVGEMLTGEISVNFGNFWRNFGKESNFSDFLKKSLPVGIFRRKIGLFRITSPIFSKNRRLAPAANPTTPSFPTLIWRSRFGLSSNGHFMCIWWSKLKLDVIQRLELNPNGYVMIQWLDFAHISIQRPIFFSNGKMKFQ